MERVGTGGKCDHCGAEHTDKIGMAPIFGYHPAYCQLCLSSAYLKITELPPSHDVQALKHWLLQQIDDLNSQLGQLYRLHGGNL